MRIWISWQRPLNLHNLCLNLCLYLGFVQAGCNGCRGQGLKQAVHHVVEAVIQSGRVREIRQQTFES